MTRAVRIDRCVCTGRTFEELRAAGTAAGDGTADALWSRAGVGQRCGLCRPYLEAMLRTGRVVFDRVLPPAES